MGNDFTGTTDPAAEVIAVPMMSSSVYATLEQVKDVLNITSTTRDDDLMMFLEAVSRDIDTAASRFFYTETATNYYDGAGRFCHLLIDDVISITEWLTDTDIDETFSGDWTESTDYVLNPRSLFPKFEMRLSFDTEMALGCTIDYHKVTGTWGYGNGTSDPWKVSGITGTVASTDGTTLTLSAEGTIKVGHTIKCGTEQMFVSAVTSDGSLEATVARGANGTTAAIHSTVAASIALYPAQATRAAMWLAKSSWQGVEDVGLFESERIGDYSYKVASPDKVEKIKGAILGNLVKGI